jgi:hypothetical protein
MRTVVCVVAAFSLGLALSAVGPTEKSTRLANVLCVACKIQELSAKNAHKRIDHLRLQKQLDRFLAETRSVDELFRLGVVCSVLAYPGEVGEDLVDRPFVYAFWSCVHRIAQTEGPEAKEALDAIERFVPLQGFDLMLFEDLRARRKKAPDRVDR